MTSHASAVCGEVHYADATSVAADLDTFLSRGVLRVAGTNMPDLLVMFPLRLLLPNGAEFSINGRVIGTPDGETLIEVLDWTRAHLEAVKSIAAAETQRLRATGHGLPAKTPPAGWRPTLMQSTEAPREGPREGRSPRWKLPADSGANPPTSKDPTETTPSPRVSRVLPFVANARESPARGATSEAERADPSAVPLPIIPLDTRRRTTQPPRTEAGHRSTLTGTPAPSPAGAPSSAQPRLPATAGELRKILESRAGGGLFTSLGIAYGSTPAEVRAAYERTLADFGPGSNAHQLAPAEAAQIVRLAARALEGLQERRTSPSEVRAILERRSVGGLFAALGIHYSAAPSEIRAAYEHALIDYGPGASAAAMAPDDAGRIVQLARRAWQGLKDRKERDIYRRDVLGIDVHLAARLMFEQSLLARDRGERRIARVLAEAAIDLAPTRGYEAHLAELSRD